MDVVQWTAKNIPGGRSEATGAIKKSCLQILPRRYCRTRLAQPGGRFGLFEFGLQARSRPQLHSLCQGIRVYRFFHLYNRSAHLGSAGSGLPTQRPILLLRCQCGAYVDDTVRLTALDLSSTLSLELASLFCPVVRLELSLDFDHSPVYNTAPI